MKNIRILLPLLLISLMLTGCFKTVHNIGYTFDKEALASLEVGKTRRANIIRELGSPSIKSTFGPETWYYISTERETVAFFKPKIKTQKILALQFGDSQVLQDIKEYSAEDAKNIALKRDTTKVHGHDVGVLEQLLGNVGRFNSPRKK